MIRIWQELPGQNTGTEFVGPTTPGLVSSASLASLVWPRLRSCRDKLICVLAPDSILGPLENEGRPIQDTSGATKKMGATELM